MDRYEKMLECNRKASDEKIERARKAIFELMDEGGKGHSPQADGKNRAFKRLFLQESISAPDTGQGTGAAGRHEPSEEEHTRHGDEQRDTVPAETGQGNAAGN